MNSSFLDKFSETPSNLELEGLESLNTESQLEALTDEDILRHFDESQLDYINELQENPSWSELSIDEKIESIKNRVAKFCHNTGISKTWENPEYAIRYSTYLLRRMH